MSGATGCTARPAIIRDMVLAIMIRYGDYGLTTGQISRHIQAWTQSPRLQIKPEQINASISGMTVNNRVRKYMRCDNQHGAPEKRVWFLTPEGVTAANEVMEQLAQGLIIWTVFTPTPADVMVDHQGCGDVSCQSRRAGWSTSVRTAGEWLAAAFRRWTRSAPHP